MSKIVPYIKFLFLVDNTHDQLRLDARRIQVCWDSALEGGLEDLEAGGHQKLHPSRPALFRADTQHAGQFQEGQVSSRESMSVQMAGQVSSRQGRLVPGRVCQFKWQGRSVPGRAGQFQAGQVSSRESRSVQMAGKVSSNGMAGQWEEGTDIREIIID